MSELNPMSGETLDLTKENIEKLKELFPEALSEDQIDFEKLRLILGDEVNDKPEKYSFTWNGKQNAIKLAQQPSTGTLRPNKEKSKNWDTTENLYIEGDNLEVLKLLQKSYAEKIKLIYIDPPYNTGNDFVYNDDFKDNIQNYFEQTGQTDNEGNRLSTNVESSGRFHTDWLNMMYPRLLLSKNLLKENGIIFINISDEEAANLKKICDEIFGESNFCADIVWNSTKSVTNTALISVSHTHTLVYFKSKEYYVKNRIEFRLPDDGEGFSNPDNDPKGPWKADPFQVGGWRPNQQYEITNPNTGKVYTPNEGSSWKNDFKTFQRIYDEGRIVFGVDGTAGPMRKRYLSEAKDRGKVAKTWWDDTETTTNGTTQLKKIFDNKKYFDNPKPIGLLKRIIQLGTTSDDNEIILDFFAGSSTTAHATMELNAEDGGNRQFIMVQLPEPLKENDVAYKDGYKNLSEISQERIGRAGEKIVKDSQLIESELDIGFKVFKLDSSNIQKWNAETENIEESLFSMENNFIQGRSHADIVYEVLLKLGLDLNTYFEESTIDGSNLYDIALGNVYVVLGNNITHEVANYIAEKQKEYKNENPSVVFNDNGFKNDNEKLNAIEILKNNGFNEEQLMSI